MSVDDKEDRIRKRAHLIWESEGRPDDRDQVHWEIATRIIDEEDRHRDAGDDRLDEAVEESFPASDPAAITQPNTGIAYDPEPEENHGETSRGRRGRGRA